MTPRQAFNQQRINAKQRNIPFLLTFDEWWLIWRVSRKWNQRGRKSDQFCMARVGDGGAYEVGNVRIISVHNNQLEVEWTPERCAKMGKGVWTLERRIKQAARMRKMLKARWAKEKKYGTIGG